MEEITRHGLFRTTCVLNNDSRRVLLNIDFNASMNIYTKAYCVLANIDIPEHLCR